MSPKNAFRMVVGMSIALTIAVVGAAMFPNEMSQEWTTLLLWNGNGGVSEQLTENLPDSDWMRAVLLLFAFVFLAFVVAVLVGLMLFWRVARLGFVFLTALSVVLAAFDGLVVMTPVEAALYQLALILDGVIVAMAYLPPINGQFENVA